MSDRRNSLVRPTCNIQQLSVSEAVRNVDDPVLGDVVILGEEKEGSVLEARTASLSDDDGIAS